METVPEGVRLEEVIDLARKLSTADRWLLVEELLAGLDGDTGEDPAVVEQAWAEEIQRRIEAADRGEVQWVPYEEAMARLDEQIRRRKGIGPAI